MSSDRFDNKILELVNNERANAGLDSLSIDSQLDQAANLHTDEMAQADRLSHQLPGEPELNERVLSAGYEGEIVVENTAAGEGTLLTTPEEVVEGWMNSPVHRANILNPELTHIGVGYNNSPNENKALGDFDVYWTQVFGAEGKSDSLAVDNQLAQAANLHTDETAQNNWGSYQHLNEAELDHLFAANSDRSRLAQGDMPADGEQKFAIAGDVWERWLNSSKGETDIPELDFTLGVGYENSPDMTYLISGEFKDGYFLVDGYGAASPAGGGAGSTSRRR